MLLNLHRPFYFDRTGLDSKEAKKSAFIGDLSCVWDSGGKQVGTSPKLSKRVGVDRAPFVILVSNSTSHGFWILINDPTPRAGLFPLKPVDMLQ
jgi:hypothetical protein